MKLFLSLLVQGRRLLELLLDGRRVKSPWLGWDVSFLMLFTQAAFMLNVLGGGQLGAGYLLGSFHHLLECFTVCCGAIAIPH